MDSITPVWRLKIQAKAKSSYNSSSRLPSGVLHVRANVLSSVRKEEDDESIHCLDVAFEEARNSHLLNTANGWRNDEPRKECAQNSITYGNGDTIYY
jgi:hypothetical protein